MCTLYKNECNSYTKVCASQQQYVMHIENILFNEKYVFCTQMCVNHIQIYIVQWNDVECRY